jgi:hypothetical protein
VSRGVRVLITTFGDGRFEINSRKMSTFKVAVNYVVSQTLAKGLRVIEVPNSLVRILKWDARSPEDGGAFSQKASLFEAEVSW